MENRRYSGYDNDGNDVIFIGEVFEKMENKITHLYFEVCFQFLSGKET